MCSANDALHNLDEEHTPKNCGIAATVWQHSLGLIRLHLFVDLQENGGRYAGERREGFS